MEKYPVYCSWCEKKGIKTIVNWIEVPGSSGICVACHADMMRELAAVRAKLETGNWKLEAEKQNEESAAFLS